MITKKDALKINSTYSDFKLKSNFHVGIIEGGPAGSYLGYYILDLAGRIGIDMCWFNGIRTKEAYKRFRTRYVIF